MFDFKHNSLFKDRKFIIISGLIVLLSFFPFVNPHVFSIDDYFLFFNGVDGETTNQFSIVSGRWFSVLMLKFHQLLIGQSGFKGLYWSYLLVFVQMLFAAYLMFKQLNLKNNWFVAVAVSVGFIHVFCAEIMTFKYGLLVNIGFSFLYFIGFGSWFLIKKFNFKFIVGVIGLILALASYQVILNVLIVITLMGFVFFWIESQENHETTTFKSILSNEYFVKLIAIAVACVLYLIINQLVLLYFDFPVSNRSSFMKLSNWQERLNEVFKTFKMILYDQDVFLIPNFTKFLTLLVIGMTLVLGIYKISCNAKLSKLQQLLYSFILVLIFSIALLSTAISSILLETLWLVPRMFTGFSFFMMFCLVILIHYLKNRILKNSILVVLVMLVYSFINVNHNIANDQAYLNELDRNRAKSLVFDIQKVDDFKNKKIFIHQKENCWANEYHIKTTYGDMNISAFCTSWSKYNLLEYVGGFKMNKTLDVDNQRIETQLKNNSDSLLNYGNQQRGVYSNDSFIFVFP